MNAVTLNPDKVYEIFTDCLYREGEDTTGHIVAEGIVQTVGFHPQRVESHRSEVEALLEELPDTFRRSDGGGWSFLEACKDRHGRQWTGMHQTMEQLVQLGIGIGKVQYLLPREAWAIMPGGMPYFVYND